MIGTLILLCPPLLAIYSFLMRNKTMKNGLVGYVYNGKLWVTWLAVIAIFASLFLIFCVPLINDYSRYSPDWEKFKILTFIIIEYISYVLVSYRPATTEEIEEAEASGKKAIKMTTSATTSMFMGILSCIGTVIASIPTLLSNALNPVLATKVIQGVTYNIIGTGFTTIMGGFVALGIIAIFVVAVIYFGSILVALLSMLVLGTLTIIKFLINMKGCKSENAIIKFFRNKV